METMTLIAVYGAIPVILVLFSVQYLALRIRDSTAAEPDPHLGRKTLLYLFFNAAVMLALFGFTMSAADFMDYAFEPAVQAQQAAQNGTPLPAPEIDPQTGQVVPPPPRDWFNDTQRSASALVTSGMIHGLLAWLVLRFATNDRTFPAVRRAFAGTRFAISGIIMATLSTFTIYKMFQKNDMDLKWVGNCIGVAMVWGPTTILHLALILWSSGWKKVAVEHHE